MQDDRQFQFGSQIELGFQRALLRRLRAFVPVVVEADFADGHDLWLKGKGAQLVEVGGIEVAAAIGMYANGGVNAIEFICQRERLPAAVPVYGGNDDLRDAGQFGAL